MRNMKFVLVVILSVIYSNSARAQNLFQNGIERFEQSMAAGLGFPVEIYYLGSLRIKNESHATESRKQSWPSLEIKSGNISLDGIILNTRGSSASISSYSTFRKTERGGLYNSYADIFSQAQLIQAGKPRSFPFRSHSWFRGSKASDAPQSASVNTVSVQAYKAMGAATPTLEIYGYRRKK